MRGEDYLFVYGSLRKAVASEAQAAMDIIAAHGQRLGEASMQGRLYAVSWYPGALSGRSAKERVRGDLWRIGEARALFKTLDAYEGREYLRRRRFVRREGRGRGGGEKLSAWVYIYAADLAGAPRIVSGDYAEWLRTMGAPR